MNTRFALLGALLGALLALGFAAAPRAQSQPVRGGVRVGASLAQVQGGTFSGPKFGLAATLFGRVALSEPFAVQPELRYVRKGGGGAEDEIEDDLPLGTFDATGAAQLRAQDVRIDGSVYPDFVEGALLARYALAGRDGGWDGSLYAGPYAGVRVGSNAEADVSGRFIVRTENQGEVFNDRIDDSAAGLVERIDQAAALLPGDAELPPIENPLASDDLFERFDYGLAAGGDVTVPLAGRRFLLGLRYELGLRDLLNQDSDAVQSAKQLLDAIDDFPQGGSGLEGRTSTLTVEMGVLF